LLDLDSYALAALGSAALEHQLAGSAGHPFEEAMNLLAVSFLWLVRSFRHNLCTLRQAI
jgi:hypothetical protein